MIVESIPCPKCMETGHDKKGNHLLVFEDGAKWCGKTQYHANALEYYEPASGSPFDITQSEVTGKIKYKPEQFMKMQAEGKLDNPVIRAKALSGMTRRNQWEVMTEEERAALQAEYDADMTFFSNCKIKNLITRHLKGEFCKLYNVRVGHDVSGAVDKHYYPRYKDGNLIAAKCRNLPKDFSHGHLGRFWDDTDLFGMQTLKAVLDSGTLKHKLLIVGGELDALSAQQMLVESQVGTKYEGRLFHVWSVSNGEAGIADIIRMRKHIDQFKEVVWAFDSDEQGQKFIKECSRLFPDKSTTLTYPVGCKDANDCLRQDRAREFVDAFYNTVRIGSESKVRSIAQLSERAKVVPKMGLSWVWKSLDEITLGIRPHMLYLFGAGSGVGKTATTKEIVMHLTEVHGKKCGVIYTEEPAHQTVRSFAGKWVNKKLELPSITDKTDPSYALQRDYTEEQANKAIDHLADKGLILVADLQGDTSIDAVMQTCEEFLSMGVEFIFIDNLTGITLKGKEGSSKVDAIDEAMKRIGNFKDEKPVSIFLYSHLKNVENGRTPHEEGGEVKITDFRGAGSIRFWCNYAFGIMRNTRAETKEEKLITYIECLKDRDQGVQTGVKFCIVGNESTGRLLEPSAQREDTDLATVAKAEQPQEDSNEF